MKQYLASAGGKAVDVQILQGPAIIVDGKRLEARLESSHGISCLTRGKSSTRMYIRKVGELQYEIWAKHVVIPVRLETESSRLLASAVTGRSDHSQDYQIKAPMPGMIKEIEVEEGGKVEPGTGLIVLEAMKMENEIRSSVHGTITRIHVQKQQSVEKSQLLIVIEPDA